MVKSRSRTAGPRREKRNVLRSPNLSARTVAALVERVNTWDGRLTWNDLVKLAAEETGRSYVRQTLYNNGSIRAAYQAHQEERRSSERWGDRRNRRRPMDGTIRRLRQQVLQLQNENSLLIERFARWVYNASVRGLDEQFLDNPLPPIDRRHR